MWPTRDDPPSPDLIAFGELVRRFRRNNYMSQRVFGARLGLDQSSVSRLERGRLPGLQLHRLIPLLKLMGRLDRAPPSASG